MSFTRTLAAVCLAVAVVAVQEPAAQRSEAADSSFTAGVTDVASLQKSVDTRLARAQQLLHDLAAVKEQRTLANTLQPYDDLLEEIRTASGLAGIVAAVHPDEAMRKAGDDLERKADALEAEISLRPDVFRALQAIRLDGVDAESRYYVERTIRELRRLGVDRPEATRAIVDCRTFSLLLVSVLRQRGIPARARCGFATYLEKTHYQDHWVCEYWDDSETRWVMEDADLKKSDVSPDKFLNASRVWAMRETKPEIVKKCGWGPDMCGQWAVRLDLIHDLAALNEFVAVRITSMPRTACSGSSTPRTVIPSSGAASWQNFLRRSGSRLETYISLIGRTVSSALRMPKAFRPTPNRPSFWESCRAICLAAIATTAAVRNVPKGNPMNDNNSPVSVSNSSAYILSPPPSPLFGPMRTPTR